MFGMNKRKISDVLNEDELIIKKPRINKKTFTDEELLIYYEENPETIKEVRYCRYSCCRKQASFGPKNGLKLRCATHKLSTDLNNRAKKCEFDGCMIQASFGPIINHKVFRCVTHKLVDDINKTNSICVFPNCYLTASFGPIKSNKLTCLIHKEKDYVNLKKIK